MSSTYEVNAVTGKLDKVQNLTETIAHADLSDMPDTGGTCLLYTSPSPRDGLLSRMPSSA